MIIALSGTHGTGKTTLAYELCSKLKKKGIGSVVLDERARECPFPINKDGTEETQTWLIVSQIQRELELSLSYDTVVVDRSIVDPIAYGNLTLGSGIYYKFLSYCKSHIERYYSMIYVLNPKKFNYMQDDGVRDMDMSFRCAAHTELVKLYDQIGVEYKVIYEREDVFEVLND